MGGSPEEFHMRASSCHLPMESCVTVCDSVPTREAHLNFDVQSHYRALSTAQTDLSLQPLWYQS